ncbi:hypothetical protein [Clostridium beijerinckii]|uniref:hypothetical protein n=1 Tax=Clostridium beijerinckii TaxID=1520 RepID=UPI001570D797|nr:hypothetical protein [Clostridium beijerinckii]NRT73704.1 hypothetical protein [Clostridium beijerinckii]
MNKVLVWGTGDAWSKIKSILNLGVCDIVAFIDTFKKAEFNEGKKVIYPIDIEQYDYDYLFIASSSNIDINNKIKELKIRKDKIVDLWEVFLNIGYYNNMKEYLRRRLNKAKNLNIDTIITGLSYARWGIDESILPNNILNLAMDSSDLYDNHLIAKRAINLNKNIKNVIIGLSYMSFEYDLSKVDVYTKYACDIVYKDLIGDSRNILGNIVKDIRILEGNDAERLDLDIMKPESVGQLSLKNYPQNEVLRICKNEALRDSNKNYPNTVKKNTIILKEYIEMLEQNNCNITLVVFPVCRIYSKHFSERLKKQFKNIINEMKMNYNFRFLDYFDYQRMLNEDFRDGSHLNKKGGRKFTHILNNDLFKVKLNGVISDEK